MKKTVLILLILSLLTCVLCACGDTSEGLTFVSNGDGTCYISGIGTCEDTELVLPYTSPAGDRVTAIGGGAFEGCNKIVSVTVPASIVSIGDGAFVGCASLESITVDENNTVFHSAGNCLIETKTKTLVVGCKASAIPIDGSVTSIGERAFEGSGIISPVIPESVTSIGKNAFFATPFYNDASGRENGVLYAGKHLIKADASVAACTIKEGTLYVADFAFAECDGLTEVFFPASVLGIGKNAFYECAMLQTVQFAPNSNLTDVGANAFYSCTSLSAIALPESLYSIHWDAFYGCSGLQIVSFGEDSSLSSIGTGAFMDCQSIREFRYGGTKEEWGAIYKGENWSVGIGSQYYICCSDGNFLQQ